MDGGRILAVVLVVVLAGCSIPNGGPADTVTPVDVGQSDPPGVSTRTNSVDADTLLDAHERALANRSYALRVDRTERVGGETVGRLTIDGAFGADPTSFRLTFDGTGDLTVLEWMRWTEFWAGDGRVAVGRRVGDHLQTRVSTPESVRLQIEPTRHSRLRGALRATAIRSVERTSDGVRIEASADRADAALTETWSGRPVVNATVILDVSEEGLVRSYDLEYTLGDASAPDRRQIRETGRIDGVGSTTVDRPPWVERAFDENATGTIPSPWNRPGY